MDELVEELPSDGLSLVTGVSPKPLVVAKGTVSDPCQASSCWLNLFLLDAGDSSLQ